MAWLEITVNTANADLNKTAGALTAAGFSDLVMEDQAEFADFLDQNRAYWDYIDEELEKKLQGLSQIKLYLEDTQARELERLRKLAGELSLPVEVKPLAVKVTPVAEFRPVKVEPVRLEEAPKAKPVLMEEAEEKKDKIDPKKLVIYSEIMKTKF